jgi:hypothetical protein
MNKPKLGLVTTGQGPRNEYVRFHKNLLRDLGVDCEICIRNGQDSLSREEIRSLEPQPGDRVIGHHVHEIGATGDRMGDGWKEVHTKDRPLIPLFQKCIDSLNAEGCDAIILCCAEEYQEDDFHSDCPLILPWIVMEHWVHANTIHMNNPKVGILITDEKHREEDINTWHSKPWMEKLKVFVEVNQGDNFGQALKKLKKEEVDMILIWGYGLSLAPNDPMDLLGSGYEIIGKIPYVTPQRLCTYHVRNLLTPHIDERRYVGYVVNTPGTDPEK